MENLKHCWCLMGEGSDDGTEGGMNGEMLWVQWKRVYYLGRSMVVCMSGLMLLMVIARHTSHAFQQDQGTMRRMATTIAREGNLREYIDQKRRGLVEVSRRKRSYISRLRCTGSGGSAGQRKEDDDKEDGADAGPRTPKKFKAFPFAYHELLELEIEDLTNLGQGVGKVTLADGARWVVMVPLVLPGERVTVRVYRNYDTYTEADLVEVLAPSKDRVAPLCPYFMQCGGCQYQHMSVTSQRDWKQKQVVTVLSRIASLPSSEFHVNPVVGSADFYGYRSKITPHYDLPRNKKDALKIGFQQRGSRIIVDIDQCLIASSKINERYSRLRQEIQVKVASNEKSLKHGASLLLREADNGYVTTDHREIIEQTVCGVKFRFKAGEFFQNNPFVLPLMVEHVLQKAFGDGDCKNLVDTYCGSGLFSLCAANKFQRVFGVEVSDLAVKAATENAKLNNLGNTNFLCGSSDAIFEKIQHLPAKDTVIIIDPPRKGCDESFLQQLFSYRPKRMVYVSCDPATQARDTKSIIAHNYKILDVTPFDLFPQTRHIENVITFESVI